MSRRAAACALAWLCACGSPTPTPTPDEVPALGASVVVAPGVTCALGAEGEVYCWGEGYPALDAPPAWRPARVGGLEGVRALSADARRVCGLGSGGEVWCWGWAGEGGAGASGPVRLGLPQPAAALAGHGRATCARLRDGALWCWGEVLEFGWGGAAVAVFRSDEPAAWGPSAWRDPARHARTLEAFEGAIRERLGRQGAQGDAPHRCEPVSGALVCEGACQSGACGPLPPYHEEDRSWEGYDELRAAPDFVCGLRTLDGARRLRCEGSLAGSWGVGEGRRFLGLSWAHLAPRACLTDAQGRAECYGPGAAQAEPRHDLDGATALRSGAHQACAQLGAEVRCWGGAPARLQGEFWAAPRWEPLVWEDFRPVRLLGQGDWGACGLDVQGVLGCGWLEGYAHLAPRAQAELPKLSGQVVGVATDSGVFPAQVCAWTQAGEAWCWRVGERGALGPPQRVEGVSEVAQVALGHEACARRQDGELWCWTWPQGEDRPTPAQRREGLRADLLLAQPTRLCAREGQGPLRCWGGQVQAHRLPWPPRKN